MKTREQFEQKELQELDRRRKQLEKKPYNMYMLVLCVVVVLIHIVDEIASNLSNMVQSSVVTEFFVLGMGLEYNEGLATMAAVSAPLGMVSMLAPFYKSLADRFGRKMFLVLNTFGFALGLVICFFAEHYMVYLVGTAVISFFIAHDMQVVFILETAPKDKRATVYAVTKCLGTVGLVLVPVLRRVFLDADATNWRPMFGMPAIACIVVGLIGFFLIQESRVFIQSRIDHLEKPYEQRHPAKVRLSKEEKKELKKKQRKAGVFPAIKYLMTHNKDLRWLTLTYMVLSIGLVPIANYYESIMSTGGMTTGEITNAQFVYPFGFALIILVGGLIGDKFGRKMTSVVSGMLSIVSFCMFIYGASHGWNSYFIGALYSCFLGGYWTCLDYLSVMASEKVPTDVRGSTLGALSLLQMAACMVGAVGLTVSLAVFADVFVGTLCAVWAVPAIVGCMLITIFKVKETKGTDLDEIE